MASARAASVNPSQEAIGQIAKQFDNHAVIQLGEYHRSLQIHSFIQQMLRDPRFICRTDDIVVEFGNSRLQKLADIYTSGGTPLSETRRSPACIARTSVPLTWNTPVYRAVYDTVRDINQTHLCPHLVRLVLGDGPLDWSKVKTAKDLESFADRDTAMATVEREVLAKHHHAFLITGEFHAEKKTNDESDGLRTAQIIEKRHPGSLFVIVTVPSPDAATALMMGPAPSFKTAHGSDIEKQPFAMIKENWTDTKLRHAQRLHHRRGRGRGSLCRRQQQPVPPHPKSILMRPTRRSCGRRAAIVREMSGQDFVAVVDDLVKEGRDQAALANPPRQPAAASGH